MLPEKKTSVNIFLKLGFYLFHPLWIPFIGTLIFFLFGSGNFSAEAIQRKLFGVIILSILAPFVLLLALRKVNDYHIFVWNNIRIRRFYLLFLCLILLTINNFLIPSYHFLELTYFFVGLLLTYSLALFFTYLKIIISLHVACLACLLSFLLSMSQLHQTNLLLLIIPLLFILGWVATDRLKESYHSSKGIIASFLIGLLPQFILLMGIFYFYKI